MATVKRFSDIKARPIKRYRSGFVFLDFAYGQSEIDGIEEYGLPHGRISIWGGSSGVGKTRLSCEIALSTNAEGYKVLYIQNEVSPSEFKGWVKKAVVNEDRFFISDHDRLDEQLETIKELRPDIVVVDSVNMLQGFSSPRQLRHIMDEYKRQTNEIGCHVIFISHLNKQGEIKGNNDLGYLGDVICSLEHLSEKLPKNQAESDPDIDKRFMLTVGKNRYGSSGGFVIFEHDEFGVNYAHSSEEYALLEGKRDYKFCMNDNDDLDYVPRCRRPKGFEGRIIPKNQLLNSNGEKHKMTPKLMSNLAKLAGCSPEKFNGVIKKAKREMGNVSCESSVNDQGNGRTPVGVKQGNSNIPANSANNNIVNWLLGRE